MSSEIKTVMVLGGRGNLGPYLISSLLKAGFKVSILSRSSSGDSPDNVPIVQSDYSMESLISVFQGQDAIICATPAANIEDQKRIIDAAVAAKIKRILPNEFGADTSAQQLGEVANLFKGKQAVVAYLRQKEAEGLSWTSLCTGAWADWMLVEGHGLMGFDVKNRAGTLFDAGDQEFTSTNVEKVGRAAAAVLLHSSETKNQYVHVHSYSLTQNQILESLERLSGSKFAMDKMAVAELSAIAQKHLDENDWDGAYYKLVTAVLYSGYDAGIFPDKAKHWNKVLGLEQEETVDDMIARVLRDVSSK